jgi:nucleoside-specific outer membrane channel protein Tsx
MLICFLFLTASTAIADEGFSSTSLELLQGHQYKLGDKDRHIFTFSHFTSYSLGDHFFFIDATDALGNNTAFYGELETRFSLIRYFEQVEFVGKCWILFHFSSLTTQFSWNSAKTCKKTRFFPTWVKGIISRFSTKKILGIEYGGFFQDLSLAFGIEMGPVRAAMVGPSLNLNVPYFQVFQLALYLKNAPTLKGLSYQLTWVWKMPIKTSFAKFYFGGFLDLMGAEGDNSTSLLAAPQFLYDLGDLWGKDGNIFLGVEYSYWNNKFGISGVHENVAQYMAKVVF